MNSDQTLSDEARVYALALTAQEIAALAGVPPPPEPLWSDPVSLVSTHGRVASGNRVHVVGLNGSSLMHRSSQDNGVTWSAPTAFAKQDGNFVIVY